MEYLIDIRFLNMKVWDILDILIVSYLIYRIYLLLKGSVAFNIFIGLMLLYIVWWLVSALEMQLLSTFLSQFVSVGVILLIIIFQPEIRKFLLDLGNTTLKQRSNLLERIFANGLQGGKPNTSRYIEMLPAIDSMSKKKIGALILFGNVSESQNYMKTGKILNANLNAGLLESIFQKESPLHDGAVVLFRNKIYAAGCILPVSEDATLPKEAGLRHRAAVGVTEQYEVGAIVVSEETGNISFAKEGTLHFNIDLETLRNFLKMNG
jgi:uncharacterized protein (TIGR00159 family)